jgi:hypothetical protein
MEVSGQLHAPAALPWGKSPRYPLDRRLGGPQRGSGRCGEEKNLALPGIEPRPYSPSLYRLSYPDPFICTLMCKINYISYRVGFIFPFICIRIYTFMS